MDESRSGRPVRNPAVERPPQRTVPCQKFYRKREKISTTKNSLGAGKGGHYERGLFTGGISRISNRISKILEILWSDSPLFSRVWGFSRMSRISKFSRISRKWTFLKRPLFQKTPFSKPDTTVMAIAKRYGEVSEVLVLVAKIGSKLLLMVKNHGSCKYCGFRRRKISSSEGQDFHFLLLLQNPRTPERFRRV